MSVAYAANDYHYHGSAHPGTTWTKLVWVRMPASPWVNPATIIAALDADWAQRNSLFHTGTGIRISHVIADGPVGSANESSMGTTWAFFKLTFTGETDPGVSADAVLSARWLLDGDAGFRDEAAAELTGLSNISPDGVGINCVTTAGADSGQPKDVALVKIFSGVALSDADALAERLYRNAQTNLANVWEVYKFGDGALTTGSVNARTLTAGGTPTYLAAEPTAILGDDPAPGGALVPGTITATPGDGEVVIAEGTAPSGGTPPYTRDLYRSTDGSRGTLAAADITLPHTDTGRTNGVEYFYTLEVSDSDAGVEDTAQVSATPAAAGGGGEGDLLPPTSLVAYQGSFLSAFLEWVDETEATYQHRVYRRYDSGGGFGAWAQVAQTGIGESTYQDVELPEGDYEWYVTAWDGTTETDPSNTIALTIAEIARRGGRRGTRRRAKFGGLSA
jgi:hypothetical protein